MNKIIFFILIVVGISYGQSGNPVVDSLTAHRTAINLKSPLASPTFTGTLTSPAVSITGTLNLGDSKYLYFGASEDMTLTHDGTDSWVYNNTGILKFGTSGGTRIGFYTSGIERWSLNSSGTFLPYVGATYDIGSATKTLSNIYADAITLNELDLTNTLDSLRSGSFSVYIPTSGASSVTTQLTMGSGAELTLSSADRFIPPDYGGADAVAGNFMYGGDIYYYYRDDLTLDVIMNNERTQEKIDSVYSYDVPTIFTGATDSIYFTDRNYIKKYYTPTTNLGFMVSSSGYGVANVVIKGSAYTISFVVNNNYPSAGSAWGTIKWVGGVTPTFTDATKYYEVLLKRLDATTILGSWTYYQ